MVDSNSNTLRDVMKADISTRPRSTQYVRRWWHHDSAVAAVNACSVSVGYTVPVQ